MRTVFAFAAVLGLAGCAFGPRTYVLDVRDKCIVNSPSCKIAVVHYENDSIFIEYSRKGSLLFEAYLDTNTMISCHWLPAAPGVAHPSLIRIMSDGARLINYTASFTGTNGTVEVYDSDGNGLPEKRLTSTPQFRCIESIQCNFITNKYTPSPTLDRGTHGASIGVIH